MRSSSGIAGTQEVIDYWPAHTIKAEVEIARPRLIDTTVNRMVSKEVRWRLVIDMAPLEA